MARYPFLKSQIVFERPMPCGAVAELANEANRYLIATITRDREPHSVGGSCLGQTRAARRVSKIAKRAYFFRGRFRALVARR
jgi:hypothetical protein